MVVKGKEHRLVIITVAWQLKCLVVYWQIVTCMYYGPRSYGTPVHHQAVVRWHIKLDIFLSDFENESLELITHYI